MLPSICKYGFSGSTHLPGTILNLTQGLSAPRCCYQLTSQAIQVCIFSATRVGM